MLRRIPLLADNAPKPCHLRKKAFLRRWAQAVISWSDVIENETAYLEPALEIHCTRICLFDGSSDVSKTGSVVQEDMIFSGVFWYRHGLLFQEWGQAYLQWELPSVHHSWYLSP